MPTPPTLIYAPINPIWLKPKVAANPLYATVPFEEWDDTCYMQPFTNEETTLQVLAKVGQTFTFKLYDIYTNALVQNFVPVNTGYTTQYQLVNYVVWETTINLTGVPYGKYYLELFYNDGVTDQIAQGSIEVRGVDETLLISYKNTINKFSAIFDTGFTPVLRVEGIIKNYIPEFDDLVYNDEIHNTTLLDSEYFDQFKAYFPGLSGYIPAWMAKRINIALGCDVVTIDGVSYQRIEGSKWDTQHSPEDDKMGISIDITPTVNNYNERLKAATTNTGNFQNVRNATPPYKLVGADFQISGIFKNNVVLAYFAFKNFNNTAFTLNIGTTPGGAELGTFPIGVEDTFTVNIDVEFNSTETVYLSGITGVTGISLEAYAVYDILDAPRITLPFSATDTLGKGATIRYKEIAPGDLVQAFDVASGLGLIGSKWEKWAFADGRNGGIDESGCVAVMFDPAQADYLLSKLDTKGGADSITLTTSQLPNFYLKMFGSDVNVGSGGDVPNNTQRVARYRARNNVLSQTLDYEISRSGQTDDTQMIGRTSSVGAGAAIDNRQHYIVGLTIIKIAD